MNIEKELQADSRVVAAGGSSRHTALNPTFVTSKRTEREFSTSAAVKDKKPFIQTLVGAEITEMATSPRMFGKINSNMRVEKVTTRQP